LLDSDQQELKDSEANFLAPTELAEFVNVTLEGQFRGCLRKLPAEGQYDLTGTNELKEALRSLVRAYPASHNARGEILRFVKRLEDGRIRLAFSEEGDASEFVHVRHPVVLLARWITREPLPDVPFCRGYSSEHEGPPTFLVWGIGTLEGYTNRAELLCAAVDYESGSVRQVTPSEAHRQVRTLVPTSGDTLDPEQLMASAEHNLLHQFDDLTRRFSDRNAILAEKARQAVKAHAERKLLWLQRQLGRTDLKENIRNLYRGWSQRIESETQTELAELDEKSRTRSSLLIVGSAFIESTPGPTNS
jgi:hypothetical protein